MTKTEIKRLTPEEKALYDAGYAQAILDRRERDRMETERLIRQCTRIPEPTGFLVREEQ